MAHARNINGGLNYSKARKQGATPDKLRELRAAAHGQGSSITTTTVAGTGQRVAIGLASAVQAMSGARTVKRCRIISRAKVPTPATSSSVARSS